MLSDSVNQTQAMVGEAVDLNGDGLMDWVEAWSDGSGEVRQTWINTGSGWQSDNAFDLPVVLADVSQEARLSYSVAVPRDERGLRQCLRQRRLSLPRPLLVLNPA